MANTMFSNLNWRIYDDPDPQNKNFGKGGGMAPVGGGVLGEIKIQIVSVPGALKLCMPAGTFTV